MARKSWDDYFMDIAVKVSERSTCPRRHVGAIIVADKRILATGYNGSLPGEDHCEDVGCLMVDGHCKRTTHAETNALYQLLTYQRKYFDKSFSSLTVYCTYKPCPDCTMKLHAWGITDLRYLEG